MKVDLVNVSLKHAEGDGILNGTFAWLPIPARLAEREDAPRLQADELERQYRVLERNAARLGLPREALHLLQRTCESPMSGFLTWTHGDNDASNTLIDGEAVCFVDWELLRWASPAVDLGNLCAHLSENAIPDSMRVYTETLSGRLGRAPASETVEGWVRDGQLMAVLRGQNDPRVVEPDCRFERPPFTEHVVNAEVLGRTGLRAKLERYRG